MLDAHHFHVRSMPAHVVINKRSPITVPVSRPIGTIAVTMVNEKEVLVSAAWCSPLDNFSRKLGTSIAIGRDIKARLSGSLAGCFHTGIPCGVTENSQKILFDDAVNADPETIADLFILMGMPGHIITHTHRHLYNKHVMSEPANTLDCSTAYSNLLGAIRDAKKEFIDHAQRQYSSVVQNNQIAN